MKNLKYILLVIVFFISGWFVQFILNDDNILSNKSILSITKPVVTKPVVTKATSKKLVKNVHMSCAECDKKLSVHIKPQMRSEAKSPKHKSNILKKDVKNEEFSLYDQIEDTTKMATNIQNKLLSEAIDYAWASDIENQIQDTFQNNPEVTTLLTDDNLIYENIECKTSVCKMTLLSTEYKDGNSNFSKEMILVGGLISGNEKFSNTEIFSEHSNSGELLFYLQFK